MCTYLFNFRRDEYRWYIHDTHPPGVTEGWWRGVRPAPNIGELSNYSVFEPYMYLPKPRVALHARYHSLERRNMANNEYILNLILKRGYCHSPPFPKTEEFCNNWPVRLMIDNPI